MGDLASMRVVGYVREAPGPDSGETAFMQSERIRRWVLHNGNQLVAVCQDVRGVSRGEGYAALLRILESQEVDAVVVPTLATLSADLINQEVMLWDLHRRGVRVISTTEEDLDLLGEPTSHPARRLLRDVLAKREDHHLRFARSDDWPIVPIEQEVLIELIPTPADSDPEW